MKLIVTLFFIMSFNIPLWANIPSLVQEFFHTNKNVLQSQYEIEQMRLQYDNLMAQKGLTLSISADHQDQDLDQTLSFMTPKRSHNFQLKVNKLFRFGGQLTVGQQMSKEVQRPFTIPGGSVSTLNKEHYGVFNFISYQQDLGTDFFGRQFRSRLRLSLLSVENLIGQIELKNEQFLMQFYQNYLEAQLYKTLIRLQTEAIKRGEERHQMIQKRVSSGLLEQVDLISSQTALLGLYEQKRSQELSLITSLDKLTQDLHREVKGEEILPLSLNQSARLPHGDEDLIDNRQLALLEKEIGYQQELLKKNKMDFLPRANLQTLYRTNAYRNEFEKSYREGFLGREKREWVIGIEISWPIGFETAKVEKAQQGAELLKKQMLLQKQRQNLLQQQAKLVERLTMVQGLLQSAKQREVYAHKNLKTYQQLYSLGKRDIESVIRAEELLIETQKSLAQYWGQWYRPYAEYALLQGKLQSYISSL